MSTLIDLNRLELKKIFEAHQQKNTISYTDSLKICTTLKIFPDLLTSQEIRKIFVTISSGEAANEKMTYLQFESFLKIIAKQAFNQNKKRSDDLTKLISHIKDASFQRYGTNLDLTRKNSSSKPIKRQKSSKLSLSTPKNGQKTSFASNKPLDQTMKYKSPSKPVVPKIAGMISLLSPSIKTLKNRINSLKPALTERKDGQTSACSTSPSPKKPNVLSKISKIFFDFQTSMSAIPKKNYRAQEKLKSLLKGASQSPLMLRLSFHLWRLSVN